MTATVVKISCPNMASLIELHAQDAQDAQLSDARLIFEITSWEHAGATGHLASLASDAPDGAVIVAYDHVRANTSASALRFEYRGFVDLLTSWAPGSPSTCTPSTAVNRANFLEAKASRPSQDRTELVF